MAGWDSSRRKRLRTLAVVGLVALSTAGCLRKGDTTGSLPGGSEADLRRSAQSLGERFQANPADSANAVRYAATLRSLGQRQQAVAVLQQAAIRNPKSQDVLGAYGRALADAGRLQEAAEALSRAHSPDSPDWRILSAQGAVADQMGEHARAQGLYEAALKLAPGEPSVLSNLGLSLALSQRLTEAERILAQAAAAPKADGRVRQNLALVLGISGKFDEAERVLARDLPPAEVKTNLAAIRGMISQTNGWAALKRGEAKPARTAAANP